MITSHSETRTVYPRGPPLRTSLSRSRPDMRTDAPLLTLPNMFPVQDSFRACYKGINASRLTIWYFAVFKKQLARITATHSEFIKLLVCRKSFEATLNDERRYALRSLFWVSFCIYNER